MAKKNRFKNDKIIKTGFHRKKKKNRGSFIIHDKYFHKAKKQGYRARSAYKLLEIQERFNLITPKCSIIDIGAAPGSFLQVIKNIIKTNIILGVDLKEIKSLNTQNIKTIVCNIFDYEKLDKKLLEIFEEKHIFDTIISDIAPNTTGIFDVDQYKSIELNIEICKFSDKYLKKGGNMLLKIFKGEDFFYLSKEIKKRFEKMKTYKPLACRDASSEEYIICLGKI